MLMRNSVARQGSSSAFQITVHKNLNGFHRAEGIPSHTSLKAPVSRKISYVTFCTCTMDDS